MIWLKNKQLLGGSPGLVVIEGDLRWKGRELDSQHQILDGYFSHYVVVKILMFAWKRPKINEIEAEDDPCCCLISVHRNRPLVSCLATNFYMFTAFTLIVNRSISTATIVLTYFAKTLEKSFCSTSLEKYPTNFWKSKYYQTFLLWVQYYKGVTKLLTKNLLAPPSTSNFSSKLCIGPHYFHYRLLETCGQSYKSSMIVIYDSRVVHDLKIPHLTTLDS